MNEIGAASVGNQEGTMSRIWRRIIRALITITLTTSAGAAVPALSSPAFATNCPGADGYRYIQSVGGPDTKVVDVVDRSTQSGAYTQLWTKLCGTTAYNQLWGLALKGTSPLLLQHYPSGSGYRSLGDVPYGWLINRNSGKCLGPDDGGNGARVRQYTCDASATNLMWYQVLSDDNTYILWVHKPTGRCLDITNVQFYDGAPLQIWNCQQNLEPELTTQYWNQRWVWTP